AASVARTSVAAHWVAQLATRAVGNREVSAGPLESARARREEVERREALAQTSLLHCLFGNPFRPVSLDTAWLTPDVVGLAEAAYQERLLPSGELDPQRLLVLADALEDAGCDNGDVLGHLRGPGVHVRGCWVVDLLTGRE